MRSDTDSSEPETQRENTAQTAQKKTASISDPDVIVEDQSSDQDEVIRKVQNKTLADTGTVTDVFAAAANHC